MARKIFWVFAFGVLFVVACGRSNNDAVSEPISSSEPNPSVVVWPAFRTGTIIGTVKFVGTPPTPKKIAINKDIKACGTESVSEELVVGPNKGVGWAVVSIQRDKDIDQVPMITVSGVAIIDQKGCHFSPHILLVRPWMPVKILNSDGVLHNFHTESEKNSPTNKAQPAFKKEMIVQFSEPEIFHIKCDVHSWMSGWIVVAEHPFYAVTDEKGEFKLENVPIGKRVLKIWHKALGELVAEVEVKENETTKILFEMKK